MNSVSKYKVNEKNNSLHEDKGVALIYKKSRHNRAQIKMLQQQISLIVQIALCVHLIPQHPAVATVCQLASLQ